MNNVREEMAQRSFADQDVVEEVAERITEATPPPPDRKPGDSWFARSISDAAAAAVGWWWRELRNTGQNLKKAWWAFWTDDEGELSNRAIDRFTDGLAQSGELDPRLVRILRETKNWPMPFDIIAFWVVAPVIVVTNFWTYIQGIRNIKAQEVNEEIRPNLLDQASLLRYLIKNPDQEVAVMEVMRKWGIPDEQLRMFIAGAEGEPSLTELLLLRNRGIYDDTQVTNSLKRQGFDNVTSTDLLELRQFYPGPSDLVSLAGREAFEPEAIREFNLDQDFELLDKGVFEKAGVSDEIARWYWVAHWNNPSLNQVFEMIHRGVEFSPGVPWSTDHLNTYYKLADINPFFGDMLRQIAFRVPTRVDTRRMFEMGVIDEDQVNSIYKAQGYDQENADFLTEFAVRLKARFGRELSRSQVEKLYSLGQITPADFDDYLVLLDYSREEAEQIRFLKDVDLEEDRIKAFLDRVEYQYKRGTITREQASSELSDGDFVSFKVTQLLGDWDDEIITQQALPGTPDLVEWLQGSLVDDETFRRYMKLKRFTDETIDLYMQQGGRLPSKTDLVDFFDRSVIEEAEFRAGLEALGYIKRDVDSFADVVNQRKARRADFERRNPGTNGSTETYYSS